MKTLLRFSVLLLSMVSFAQPSERDVIEKIDSINAVALTHYNNHNIVESFKLFNEAIRLSDSINDNYGNAVANFTIGKIYNFMHDYDKSETSFQKVIQVSKSTNDNFLMASSYYNLGSMFMNKKPPSDPIPYFEKALKYASQSDVRDQFNIDRKFHILFQIYTGLAQAHLHQNNANKAMTYLAQAEDHLKYILDDSYAKAQINYLYGQYYRQKQLYNSANVKFLKAVDFLEEGFYDDSGEKNALLSEIYKEIASVYAFLEKDGQAYKALLKHTTYRNEFLNEEKIQQEIIAGSKFSIENYKNAAQLANSEKMAQMAVNKKIRVFNLIITGTVILLVISLITVYRSYRSKNQLSHILKMRNKQLEISKTNAEKASELKSNFISNVTHELRTPLYGVVGLTSLLLKNNDLSQKDSKLLKSLKYSGDYLLNLVNDILQIGKIESSKIELKNVTVNLRAMLDNIVNSFDYRLEESNNQVELTIDESIPQYLKCDNVRLSQVLINLIGNSIKFTENGKIDIRVKLCNLNQEKVSLCFEIEDDGPGIAKEKQKTIFETFTQLDDNSNTNYQGTGLGLPISKNIIELFGSTLHVESELGSGTLFHFNLTFDVSNEANKVKIIKRSKAKPMSSDSGKRYKILVAEDNKINQIVTQNLLQKENFECVIVKNGLEALEAHQETTFDLILMDINMPIMNGNESTMAIREFDKTTPIIALTAADIEQVKADYKVIGFDDIITKPFDNYEFFQTIAEHIDRTKLLRKPKFTLEKVS